MSKRYPGQFGKTITARVAVLALPVVCLFCTDVSGKTSDLSGCTIHPPLPVSLDFSPIRAIPVQHDGRWPPLDTVARDLVESVTGEEMWHGHDPVALLLAWTFNSAEWQEAPIISISNAELRRELRLPADREVFSYAELRSHPYLHTLVDELSRIPEGRKLDPLEAKVSDIHDKLITLQRIFSGRVLALIPDPADPLGSWSPIGSAAMFHANRVDPTAEAWAALRDAFRSSDAAAFSSASRRVAAVLDSLPAAHRPADSLIQTELRYNRLQPFRTAWQLMAVGALLSVAAMGIRRRWFDVLAMLGLLAGFVVLTYGLSLRWQIAGRIPAANMFESLLFLGWGMGAFAILSMFVLRHRIVPLTASVMGALALMLADVLPMDHFVRPIPPVLHDTIWMSVHVPVIMVSYSVLALGVLIAHGQLIAMAAAPGRRKLAEAIDSLHYWYIHVGSILLFAGIVTGSMWAASSWGRYWGWDPKEVWSLAALLAYLAILHVRINQQRVVWWVYAVGAVLTVVVMTMIAAKLGPLSSGKVIALVGAVIAMAAFVFARGPFGTALKSVLAFWLIIMTYVGVNYVLGTGLHSYGFGTGAVARSMFRTGGMDLGLVAICCVIYLLRRRPQVQAFSTVAPPAPA